MRSQRYRGGEPPLLAVSAKAPWPTVDGYSLRTANFLGNLARWWDVTLLSPSPEGGEGDRAPDNIRWIQIPEVPATNVLPWLPERQFLADRVERQMETDGRPYQAVLLWNGTEFLAHDLPGLPTAVADRIDCEALQAWRNLAHWPGAVGWLRNARRTLEFASFERRVLRSIPGVAVTGPEDARALRRLTGRDQITVIPNGVALPDLGDYPGEAQTPTVVFTGTLDYRPNIEAVRYFTRQVWSFVRSRVPDARFVVAGRSPVREIRELAETTPAMEVRVDVPDITEVIRRAWVAVAPMRSGSGIKNKVLEAWAAERPVVLSSLATNGLEMNSRTNSLVWDDPARMGDAVVRLLRNEKERRELGRAGRDTVEEHHGWRRATRRLHRLLVDAAARNRERAGASPA